MEGQSSSEELKGSSATVLKVAKISHETVSRMDRLTALAAREANSGLTKATLELCGMA